MSRTIDIDSLGELRKLAAFARRMLVFIDKHHPSHAKARPTKKHRKRRTVKSANPPALTIPRRRTAPMAEVTV